MHFASFDETSESRGIVGSPERKRGRRSDLDDEELTQRRNQLVQALEGVWGDIGWTLPRCRKAEDLIDAFSSLDQIYVQNLISPFRRSSSEVASDNKIRATRSRLRMVVPRRYKMAEMKRNALEQLQSADVALSQSTGHARRQLKSWRKKCRKEAAGPYGEYQELSREEASLQLRLANLEASFARQQLFRFLKSKRYELTPLNLANAMAGVPYMGWRQSMRRTSGTECIIANGQTYQVFKAIRYLVNSATTKAETALLNHFRNGILQLPGRHRTAKKELAENWLYVQRAIRQACRSKVHPRALLFEIMRRYQKQTQSRSYVDMALAAHSKLAVSVVTKVAHAENAVHQLRPA